MHARERIIRERFADQVCAHCGARYPASGIVVLARRPAAWMILASCEQCRRHSIFVVRFSSPHTATPDNSMPDATHLLPDALLSPFTNSPPMPLDDDSATAARPISDHDVDAMHDFLSGFGGDFRSLFAHQHPRGTDDSSSS